MEIQQKGRSVLRKLNSNVKFVIQAASLVLLFITGCRNDVSERQSCDYNIGDYFYSMEKEDTQLTLVEKQVSSALIHFRNNPFNLEENYVIEISAMSLDEYNAAEREEDLPDQYLLYRGEFKENIKAYLPFDLLHWDNHEVRFYFNVYDKRNDNILYVSNVEGEWVNFRANDDNIIEIVAVFFPEGGNVAFFKR